MKLHFDPSLDYQLAAVEAACGLFRGQEGSRADFAVARPTRGGQHTLGLEESDLGIGNRIAISEDALLWNLRDVQARNALPRADAIASRDFTVEMETGTGKTYVYLRTIFELHKRFGFLKFVIVVPSIAIKEGVYKTLQVTEEHFRALYGGLPYDYFLYDSARLGQVRRFATGATVQIMVMTVGAINKKDVNNLYKENERTGDERPVDLIRATHPIVIVDEPQSVDGGLNGAGRAALAAMNPLCTLRYSATHVEQHHMVYRLDAVDAYERRLVKQIEVAAATVIHAHNHPFLQLVSVSSRRGDLSAKVLLDIQRGGGVRRAEVVVRDGDDLASITQRSIYANHRIGDLRAGRSASLELRAASASHFLAPGESWGDVDPLAVQRQMIRRTIREHLDKARRLHRRGIKVLSLFFIDAVDRYRRYDEGHANVRGPYAAIFEEEYYHAAVHPDYVTLFSDGIPPLDEVHGGYFSIDRRGAWTNTSESTVVDRENAERAYSLIMRDKERLLSFDTPLAFIFSHSALKEGWDNPNVFQVCSLRDIRSERERRQTIGRGLRLCVNQAGVRVHDDSVNTLTVVADESYEAFAAGLQQEFESETGIRFGYVARDQFAAIRVDSSDGTVLPFGTERSLEVWNHLLAQGYIDDAGRVLGVLRAALRAGTLSVPASAAASARTITTILRRIAGGVTIRDADARRSVRPRQAVLRSADFRELWERIRYKTSYHLEVDGSAPGEAYAQALRDAPPVSPPLLQWRKALLSPDRAGIGATEIPGATTQTLEEPAIGLPDVLTELESRTQLTRRTIARALVDSGRLEDFRRNPQRFIEIAATAMNSCKRLDFARRVRYALLGPGHYYSIELFDQETVAYARQVMEDQEGKTPYDLIRYDVESEAAFARALELNSSVKLFAKLPGWFKIPTPLGSYNPDWAVLMENEGWERLYFVVETKGSLDPADLRERETLKIECGKAHFEALRVREAPARYVVATSVDDLMTEVTAANR